MNLSFFYTQRSQFDPTAISLIALPTWLQVSLRAQGKTIEDMWTDNPKDVWNIMSSRDLQFHEDITHALEEYLFEPGLRTHKYGTHAQDALEHLKQDWHMIPFAEDCELNLHPVILGSNLIGIVHLTGEDAKRICETDIYERMLRCYHKLATAQLGTKVWQSPLAIAILKQIQSASQVA